MARRQRGELPTSGVEQYAATDQQCAGARLNDGRKCSIDFAWGFGVQAQEMTPEVASRGVHITLFYFETCITWIAQPGDGGRRRHQLMQQLEAFRLQRGTRKTHASDIAARPA